MAVPLPRRKIILDTDPGVGIPGTDADDPLAILLALGDPRLDLLAVTTIFGNTPPRLGARGAVAVLAAAGRSDIPVAPGMATRLDGTLPAVLETAYAGARGREGAIPLPPLADDDGTAEHAADLIVRLAHAHPGEITIVAIGPQTNVAMALLREPRLAQWLAGVVFMGGGLGLDPTWGRGNVTAVAECNMYFDAGAADVVFRSGVPLTMVGLDVTNPATGVVLGRAAMDAVVAAATSSSSDAAARDPVAALFGCICTTYLEAPMFEWAADGCVLYDPLAVAVAADPELGTFKDMALVVETKGEHTTGQTLEDKRPGAVANVRVMVGVDGAKVVPCMLERMLAAGSSRRA